jgi:hypothetical protein
VLALELVVVVVLVLVLAVVRVLILVPSSTLPSLRLPHAQLCFAPSHESQFRPDPQLVPDDERLRRK